MIGDRFIQIIKYLEKNNETTIKEIASALDLKERQVRYDIERINERLIMEKMPLIEKRRKGSIYYTHDEKIKELFNLNSFVYTNEQRISFILLIALFDSKRLNLKKLSEDFEVSRSSIKNDLNVVSGLLKKVNCELSYENTFILKGNSFERYQLMISEFTKYIYMYGRKRTHFNGYEKYAMYIFKSAYHNLEVKDIIVWIKQYLESHQIVLMDSSFRWYIANIMVTLWYFLNDVDHPLKKISNQSYMICNEQIQNLEKLTSLRLDKQKRLIMTRLLDYTNHTFISNTENDNESARIVSLLISKMVVKTKFNFGNDIILFEGLLNHMKPLLRRIHDNVEIGSGDIPVLTKKHEDIFGVIKEVINEIEELKEINSDIEIAYIAFHFIAGIKRRLSIVNKKVLVVCGLGYALTKMVEETLQSEFQIEIIDVIPSYKLHLYDHLNDVDFIISTMDVDIELEKVMIRINPFLSEEDYFNLSKAGISRKKLLPNYFGIYSRFDFLSYHEREKVMNVIQEELGYQNIRNYKNVLSLIDILRLDTIQIFDQLNFNQNSISKIFHLEECANDVLENEMFEVYHCPWIDNDCILLHNINKNIITKTKMAMIVLKEPCTYKDKNIKVLFTLVSKEKTENVLAIKQLSKLFMDTDFMDKIKRVQRIEDIYQNLIFYANRL